MKTYEQMIKGELKSRFNTALYYARTAATPASRARLQAEMARLRREISRLPEWARQYR